MKFVIIVWLLDTTTSPDDPDREWVACYVVDGASESSALAWGTHVAASYASRNNLQLLSTECQSVDTAVGLDLSSLPLISEGETPPDERIGW